MKMETHIFLLLLLSSGALSSCPYSRHLNISAPKLEALSGSCFLMPCTFTTDPNMKKTFNPNEPVRAIWSKNHPYIARTGETQYVVYDSSEQKDRQAMEMIGDLQQKNCTTLLSNVRPDHSSQYFLRIENAGFKVTAVCDPLQIQVRDSPWSPQIVVQGSLKENETVIIFCSAPTPCPQSPPKLSWNFHQNPLHFTVRHTDGTFTTYIQHKMTLSESHDGLQVICTAVYPVDGGEKKADSSFSLTVDYAPKNTLLSVGQSVSLSCSSRARPEVNISWFRLTSGGLQKVHEGEVYSFNISDTTPGQYFCQAKNTVGEQNSTVITLGLEALPGARLGISAYNVVQICGIVVLFTALLLIECLIREKTTKHQQNSAPEEPDYVNRVVEDGA